MTKQTRRKFSAEFKAKVALEAIKNQKTLAHFPADFLHPDTCLRLLERKGDLRFRKL